LPVIFFLRKTRFKTKKAHDSLPAKKSEPLAPSSYKPERLYGKAGHTRVAISNATIGVFYGDLEVFVNGQSIPTQLELMEL
jgi:hypothetical protein